MVFTPMTLLEIFRAGLVLHSLGCFNVSMHLVFHSNTVIGLRVTAYRFYIQASTVLTSHQLFLIVYIILITQSFPGVKTLFSFDHRHPLS